MDPGRLSVRHPPQVLVLHAIAEPPKDLGLNVRPVPRRHLPAALPVPVQLRVQHANADAVVRAQLLQLVRHIFGRLGARARNDQAAHENHVAVVLFE